MLLNALLLYFYQVGDCLGTLIKTFKASFLPMFDELSSYLTPMWVSFLNVKVSFFAIHSNFDYKVAIIRMCMRFLFFMNFA